MSTRFSSAPQGMGLCWGSVRPRVGQTCTSTQTKQALPLQQQQEQQQQQQPTTQWQLSESPFPLLRLNLFLALIPAVFVDEKYGRNVGLVYRMYQFVVVVFQCLTIPAAWYACWLYTPESPERSNRPMFRLLVILLTILGIQAPLAWAFVHRTFGSEHYKQKINQWQVEGRQLPDIIETPWSSIYTLLSFTVVCLWVVWLEETVYLQPVWGWLQLTQKGVFVAIPVTFIYRLGAPMMLCQIFSLVAKLHIDDMEQYKQKHEGPVSGIQMFEVLKQSVRDRENTEGQWVVGFCSTVFMPCISAVMVVILYIQSPDKSRFIQDFYFVLSFVLHLLIQAVHIFCSAASISAKSKKVRREIVEMIVHQDTTFTETGHAFQVDAYTSYLSTCCPGFCVLGVPVHWPLVITIGQAFAMPVLLPALQHVFM